jgi:hypothetical protein
MIDWIFLSSLISGRNQGNTIAFGGEIDAKIVRCETFYSVSDTNKLFRASGFTFLVFFPTVAV